MLAFFIMLNSVSTLDQRRTKLALGSLIGSFGVLPGGVSVEPGNEIHPPARPVIETTRTLESEWSATRFTTVFDKKKYLDTTHLQRVSAGTRLTFSAKLLFEPGTAVLKRESQEVLTKIVEFVSAYNNPIRVTGHSDSDAPAAGYSSNWELSLARAAAVAAGLTAAGQLAPERVSIEGYAHYQPVESNATPEGKERNRRVELTLLGVLAPKNGDNGIERR